MKGATKGGEKQSARAKHEKDKGEICIVFTHEKHQRKAVFLSGILDQKCGAFRAALGS